MRMSMADLKKGEVVFLIREARHRVRTQQREGVLGCQLIIPALFSPFFSLRIHRIITGDLVPLS
jgi:hypothetical protein